MLAALSACAPDDPSLLERHEQADAGLGTCTQEEPGTPARDGSAVFYVDRTETAGGTALGRHAAMLTCVTPGPGGAALTLVLPNLPDSLPRPGRYRVQAPGVIPEAASSVQLAWAETLIPTRNGIAYRGMGGEVVIETMAGREMVGSYLVAFERAAEGSARGPARLVLGGAFEARRNTLPRQTALPRPGR